MKMGKVFYLGVALCLAGIVLMSLPDRACVDCDDEVITEIPADIVDEVTGD